MRLNRRLDNDEEEELFDGNLATLATLAHLETVAALDRAGAVDCTGFAMDLLRIHVDSSAAAAPLRLLANGAAPSSRIGYGLWKDVRSFQEDDVSAEDIQSIHERNQAHRPLQEWAHKVRLCLGATLNPGLNELRDYGETLQRHVENMTQFAADGFG